MAKYVIEGGVPLQGRVKLLGAKNVGFKLLIASLLADSPSTIENIARVSDVEAVCDVIKSLGGKAEFVGDHKVTVDPRGLNSPNVPVCQGEKTRAPTLCVGPLVARFGRAFVAAPGGDAIGKRPIDRHMKGFESLGLVAAEKEGGLELVGSPRGGNY